VLRILKSAGARVAIVFHDVTPYSSPRLIDQLRCRAQLHTMRRALQLAEHAIFTVPLEKVSWLAGLPEKASFIPVGPNLPIPGTPASHSATDIPTIGVFSITGGEPGKKETRLIVDAVQHVSQRIGPLGLSVFGRHAELREDALREGLQNLPVQLSIEGVVDADQVVKRLAACDVLFFVRNGISTRRSSAIAGIAAGLPIIAYANSETAAPITDAGLLLVNPDHPEEFSEALLRILTDASLRAELAARSRSTYQTHFAWPVIAARFAELLRSN
jgi:glycosyltransferase involved in cell wall biosynthesis